MVVGFGGIVVFFRLLVSFFFFFFNDTATTEIYTFSLHDALPILHGDDGDQRRDPDAVDERLQERRRRHVRSEEHTSELQSLTNLVCRLLLEKKNDPFILCGWQIMQPSRLFFGRRLFCLGIGVFFFTDTATTEIYTLSLHDALPISATPPCRLLHHVVHHRVERVVLDDWPGGRGLRRSEEHTSELQSLTNLVCR